MNGILFHVSKYGHVYCEHFQSYITYYDKQGGARHLFYPGPHSYFALVFGFIFILIELYF